MQVLIPSVQLPLMIEYLVIIAGREEGFFVVCAGRQRGVFFVVCTGRQAGVLLSPILARAIALPCAYHPA